MEQKQKLVKNSNTIKQDDESVENSVFVENAQNSAIQNERAD